MTGAFALVLALLGVPAVSGAPPKEEGAPGTSTYSEKQLLKNWALSRCIGKLGKIYNSDGMTDDAYKTAAGYLEFSHSPLEAFHRMDALVDRFLNYTYSGSVKSKYDTMKCVDLFHSDALDALASRYARVARKRR